jgi:transposase
VLFRSVKLGLSNLDAAFRASAHLRALSAPRRKHDGSRSRWMDRRLECARGGGQIERWDLTALLGFRRMEAMTKHRWHSAVFKRQVAEEFIAGETLQARSKRHDISRQLIRIWVGKLEAGALDDDVQAADLLQEYEAKIAALERMVGRQALEIELLKGASKHAPRPRSASTSVVTGPVASPSAEGAS